MIVSINNGQICMADAHALRMTNNKGCKMFTEDYNHSNNIMKDTDTCKLSNMKPALFNHSFPNLMWHFHNEEAHIALNIRDHGKGRISSTATYCCDVGIRVNFLRAIHTHM